MIAGYGLLAGYIMSTERTDSREPGWAGWYAAFRKRQVSALTREPSFYFEPTMGDDSADIESKLYCASRRFDITTALVVTTAYAAVFAVLQSLNAPTVFATHLAVFFTLVALGQAVFFRGHHPRWASLLVGSAYFLVGLTVDSFSGTNTVGSEEFVYVTLFFALSGAFWGYLAGVLVGSLFMIVDGIRQLTTARAGEKDSEIESRD